MEFVLVPPPNVCRVEAQCEMRCETLAGSPRTSTIAALLRVPMMVWIGRVFPFSEYALSVKGVQSGPIHS
jgi:hypothetical protein